METTSYAMRGGHNSIRPDDWSDVSAHPSWPTVARLSRRWVPRAFVLALAGCSGLLGGGAPAHLYRLTPKSTYPPNLPHPSVQLLVDVPLAPAGLDNSRIALSRSPISIDYFADSEWTDRAPLLVQTALLQSFENSKAITALDRESVGLRADFILRTEIRHFEAVYDSSDGPPEVWVAINVRLVNPSGRRSPSEKRTKSNGWVEL